MKSLSKTEVAWLFANNEKHRYKKRGVFLYRPAKPGETVLTIVCGHLETFKKCNEKQDKEPQVVLRNIQIGSSAEEYIVDKKQFDSRYECQEDEPLVLINGVGWGKATAKGEVLAFEYQGETILFKAPWGEDMLCHQGDFLASPVNGDPNDIYRIERETFNQTYSDESIPQTPEETDTSQNN